MFLKFPKDTKLLYILKYEDWEDFRDFLIELPNNFMRKYKTKKYGDNIDFVIESIANEFEEQDKEPVFLNARTINKHFNIFSMFLNYLKKTQKIKSNPLENITQLKEIPNPYKNFTNEDLSKLFNTISDTETKNFFKLALYTGLRLSAIINIKKEDIELHYNEAYKLDITKDKTTNGIRTITIHNQIKEILYDFKMSNREYLFFDTNSKDKVQKYINPLIYHILNERKTIHGFRKNFTIKLYKATENNNLRKYIVGHSQKADLTFTIYNLENVDFDKMETAINEISYPIIEPKKRKLELNIDDIFM